MSKDKLKYVNLNRNLRWKFCFCRYGDGRNGRKRL